MNKPLPSTCLSNNFIGLVRLVDAPAMGERPVGPCFGSDENSGTLGN
jgi:hypothetical protein